MEVLYINIRSVISLNKVLIKVQKMYVKLFCNLFCSTMTGRQSKLLILPAIFRLVATCEVKQNEGSLEGIDALLGLY